MKICQVYDRLARLTTQAHQNLICSPAGNILFFKALEQNKADFVKLFIQQNIDLMESEKTTSRIFNLFKTRFVQGSTDAGRSRRMVNYWNVLFKWHKILNLVNLLC